MTPPGLKRSSPPRPKTRPRDFRVSRFFSVFLGLEYDFKFFFEKQNFLKFLRYFFFGPNNLNKENRVSVQGVESLWGDCRFIPAD